MADATTPAGGTLTAGGGEVLVTASGLTKTFSQRGAPVEAVREATFEIRQGEQIALTGPSGSGKSTLLHLVAGLDTPTSGSIEWPGLGPRDALRPGLISLSFQGPSLLPPLTVVENVALPLLLMNKPEKEATAAAAEMVERLDLTPVADKLPEELSGGQMQRAAVARSLVGAPRLVLADEPTGQLDRSHAQELLRIVLALVESSGAALVIATHDMAIAERLTTRWQMTDRRLETGVVLRSP